MAAGVLIGLAAAVVGNRLAVRILPAAVSRPIPLIARLRRDAGDRGLRRLVSRSPRRIHRSHDGIAWRIGNRQFFAPAATVLAGASAGVLSLATRVRA